MSCEYCKSAYHQTQYCVSTLESFRDLTRELAELKERRTYPEDVFNDVVERLTRERDEYQNEAMSLMANQAVLCAERDAALAEAKAAREALQRAEGHMLTLIDERDEARAQNERTFQALCAAQDSHGNTMRERDEARSVVDDAYGHQDHNDCGQVLAKALKKWWML